MKKFHAISVREDKGADIVEEYTVERLVVLVDPIMYVEVKNGEKFNKSQVDLMKKIYTYVFFNGIIGRKKKRY
ncbi:hypothetical protein GNF42_05165 [Clostridium perfringens]|uniref:hypothetical protein n=1 Tax=Clostridium perfringens TaxID=1502 RepID=UPI001CAD22DD|nr:hypothetical protein [Clostridium perfringens]EHK2427503.1 hypothetical protein [Clostridium perfringens]EHK2428495.1 hypothetical protein [Clostridium perfringens]MDK0703835.1 hypothetical protein [Clostridium perfringens]MDK0901960.1 hypothetical protein [Clostridium perfringens]MDM0617940.1 hypothetical protein [Clostridium perfringens]